MVSDPTSSSIASRISDRPVPGWVNRRPIPSCVGRFILVVAYFVFCTFTVGLLTGVIAGALVALVLAWRSSQCDSCATAVPVGSDGASLRDRRFVVQAVGAWYTDWQSGPLPFVEEWRRPRTPLAERMNGHERIRCPDSV